jgi:hypothetical protein
MVKLRHVNRLVEYKVVYLPVSQLVKCKVTADQLKCLQTLLRVIPENFHWLVITLYHKGASPEYSHISMGIKFQTLS